MTDRCRVYERYNMISRSITERMSRILDRILLISLCLAESRSLCFMCLKWGMFIPSIAPWLTSSTYDSMKLHQFRSYSIRDFPFYVHVVCSWLNIWWMQELDYHIAREISLTGLTKSGGCLKYEIMAKPWLGYGINLLCPSSTESLSFWPIQAGCVSCSVSSKSTISCPAIKNAFPLTSGLTIGINKARPTPSGLFDGSPFQSSVNSGRSIGVTMAISSNVLATSALWNVHVNHGQIKFTVIFFLMSWVRNPRRSPSKPAFAVQ